MPTMNYRTKNGKRVKGVTTILGIMAKPALIYWGYSQGLENYTRVTEQVSSILSDDCGQDEKLGLVQNTLQDFQVGGLYDKRDKAADAGTLAHALIEADLKGLEMPTGAGLSKEIREKADGCYLAFLEWKDTTKFKMVYSELPLVSEVHGFGGCLDIGGETRAPELIDLKTSKDIYWNMWCQLAGYGILWNENKPETPLQGYNILCIKPDGGFAHERKTNLDDEMDIFLHLNSIQKKLDQKGIKL